MATGESHLRFGVAFADGRKATTVGPRQPPGEEAPAISLVTQGGSGGGGLSWDIGYRVFAVPPAGAITFAVAWPSFEVPENVHGLDAAPIVEAATRAEELWADMRPFRNSGRSRVAVVQDTRGPEPGNGSARRARPDCPALPCAPVTASDQRSAPTIPKAGAGA